MTSHWECTEPNQLIEIAQNLLQSYDNRILVFYGPMGVGKTTFTKALCKVLGVKDTVSSPTFSLVNEYEGGDGEAVYHFDFYRIDDETEAMDMGCDEYFYSGSYCLIEWPEKIPNLIPEGALEIRMEQDGAKRIININ